MKHHITVLALGTLVAFQVSGAAIIKVYDLKGNRDYDAMALVAEALKERQLAPSGEPETELEGEAQGFGYRIVPGSRMTPGLSLVPGSSSYFWSSTSYTFEPGFSFKGGGAMFNTAGTKTAPEEALKKEAPGALPVTYATALTSARVSGGSLQLRYTLERPAKVSLRIVGIDGKVAGRWSWRDDAGAYARSVDARLAHGVYLMHWSGDGVTRTTRLAYDGSR